MFGARLLYDMNIEIPVDEVNERVGGLIPIRIFSNSVIRGGTVELRKEQTAVSLAVIERTRKHHFHPVVESLPEADSSFVGIPASGFDGGFYRVQVTPTFCDDVDHRDKSSGAVDRGSRASDDLDPFNQIHVHYEFRTDQGAVKNIVVHTMAVEQKKNAGVVVPGP